MTIENTSPMLGADPEMFLYNKQQERLMPAFGLIGGTKEEPKPFVDLPQGFAYQEDGAALEFNVPPAPTSVDFCRNIRTAMNALSRTVLPLIYAQGVGITLTPEELNHKSAQNIGCKPDFNAYDKNGEFKRQPFTAEQLGSERYAGGHFHVQYNTEALPHWAAARFLDLFLGLPSLRYDSQGGRREKYGRPGLYRPKSYGIEYRTLSNFWLFMGRERLQVLADNAFTFANFTYTPVGAATLNSAFQDIPWDLVERAILNEDRDRAVDLIDQANSHRLGIMFV